MMLTDNTPIDTYQLNGHRVLVKREDLSCPFPGPSFSKLRGVYAHIAARPEQTIGVLDTFHSKAGWAVAYVCQSLGKHAVNFFPVYTVDRGLQDQQVQSLRLDARLIKLKAGRSAVLYHEAKKQLARFPNSYMMPNALKLLESVTENEAEAWRTRESRYLIPGTLVISISSGTVASGVARAFLDWDLVFHMGYSRSTYACQQYMEGVSGCSFTAAKYIDEGYNYADAVDFPAPFPANPFYDLKAWKWLHDHVHELKPPILFWNIGA